MNDLVSVDRVRPFHGAGPGDVMHASGLLGASPAPERLLAEVAGLARPGGWVVLQEVDAASWELPAGHPRRDRSLRILRAAAARSHPDCARFLPHWLRRAGLGEVQTWSVACMRGVDQSHARAAVIGPDAARRLLRGGLGTPAELETLRADLASAGLRFTVVQAWGRRPGRAEQGPATRSGRLSEQSAACL